MAIAKIWSDFFDASNHYTGPPLSDAMVASAERALGYTLPASYLHLLRVKNGGCPKRQCHPTGGTHWSDNHVRVVTIFGIGGQWGIDSERFGTRHMIQQAGLPEIGIVVGWTPTAGHDAIMLDYSIGGPRGEPRVVQSIPRTTRPPSRRRTSRSFSAASRIAGHMTRRVSGRWRKTGAAHRPGSHVPAFRVLWLPVPAGQVSLVEQKLHVNEMENAG